MIRGERKIEEEDQKTSYHRREREAGFLGERLLYP